MDTKALLKFAAKAAINAGADIIDSEAGPQIFERFGSDGSKFYRLWIPHDDDGDSLRLAVKLGLDVEMHGCNSTHPYACAFDCERNIAEEEQPSDGDPYAATRRAIFRAAAEIGRNMP